MMTNFIRKILVFTIPLAVILTVPSLILLKTGESLWDVEWVIKAQKKGSLVGYAYNQSNARALKWHRLQQHQSDVVALGSSRVLEFREEMFNTSFYNSGWVINGIKSFKPYLESIPKSNYPKILIIGLDQNLFNENWDDLNEKTRQDIWKSSFSSNLDYKIFLGIYRDLFKKKYSVGLLTQFPKSPRIGLNAFLNSNGFRTDGSMYYHTEIADLLNEEPFEPAIVFKGGLIEARAAHKSSFMGADSMNMNTLPILDEFVSFCESNNIYVISFLPPMADVIYETMLAEGNHGYLQELAPSLSALAAGKGFEFYDFSHPSLVGSSDLEMIDGQHGSEVTYAKILLKILESDSELRNYVNVEKLRADLNEKLNRYTLYP